LTVRWAALDRFGLVTWEGKEPMLRMLQVDELRRRAGGDTVAKIVAELDKHGGEAA
jgi:hypothetical protein